MALNAEAQRWSLAWAKWDQQAVQISVFTLQNRNKPHIDTLAEWTRGLSIISSQPVASDISISSSVWFPTKNRISVLNCLLARNLFLVSAPVSEEISRFWGKNSVGLTIPLQKRSYDKCRFCKVKRMYRVLKTRFQIWAFFIEKNSLSIKTVNSPKNQHSIDLLNWCHTYMTAYQLRSN